MTTVKEEIQALAQSMGFASFGVAKVHTVNEHDKLQNWLDKGYHGEMHYMHKHRDLRKNPQSLLETCRSVLCFADPYYPESLPSRPPQSRPIAKYAMGRDYHKVLKKRLGRIVEDIEKKYPGSQNRICVDSAPIMEHYWAKQSGIGFLGKNSLLISKNAGSYVYLGEILSSVELEADSPSYSQCAECRRCMDACPTQAIVQEGQIDARKCLSYHTIEKKSDYSPIEKDWLQSENTIFGCDICQDVCPFNQRLRQFKVDEYQEKHMEKDIHSFYSDTENNFFKRFAGSPVMRAGREKLNKSIALHQKNNEEKHES